jgi:hypothetical protein
MDKPNRVRQLYGYTVCLIAVVAGLISTITALNNAFDLSNPLVADRFGGENLGSFEAYKATRGGPAWRTDAKAQPDTVSDATLRARYEALRADRIDRNTFQARKQLVTSLVVLLSAIVLFVAHWRWLRRVPDDDAVKRPA